MSVSKGFAVFLILIMTISNLSLLMVKPASAQPTVHKVSQTFELTQGATSGVAIFDLLIGDHIEGSVSVSNLGPYPLGPLALAMHHSGTSYEVVDVSVSDPNWHSLNGNTSFFMTPIENSFNFSFTAQEQGLYRMWAFSGAMDYLQNAKNPVMTLSYEWTGTPMKVNILSPLSQAYEKSNVSLIYAINRPMDWAGYSLDGAKDVTLWRYGYPSPNTTLTGLAIGVHSLTIYTNDSWGNIDSKTVTFTIEKPQTEIFGSTIIIAVIAVPAVIVCLILGLLLYRMHRKTISQNKLID
jgi:hypothetical protein